MQHLRKIFAFTFLAALLGGCSDAHHNGSNPCPRQSLRYEDLTTLEPVPVAPTIPAELGYHPVPTVYRLDNRRKLEVWDTSEHGHYTFVQDGKRIRSEPILWCFAAPLLPDGELSSPAIRLNGDRSQQVVVCQQSDDHYLYTVFKIASGFPKLGHFESKSPLTLVEVGNSYRFSGEDYLPDGGAHQFAPKVLFKFANGKLKFDREAMRKRLPTHKELCHLEREIRSKFKQPIDIPVEVFDTLFAFYYSGEVKRAKQFLNSVYPKTSDPNNYDRESQWQFVKDQVAQSSYRTEIER